MCPQRAHGLTKPYSQTPAATTVLLTSPASQPHTLVKAWWSLQVFGNLRALLGKGAVYLPSSCLHCPLVKLAVPASLHVLLEGSSNHPLTLLGEGCPALLKGGQARHCTQGELLPHWAPTPLPRKPEVSA